MPSWSPYNVASSEVSGSTGVSRRPNAAPELCSVILTLPSTARTSDTLPGRPPVERTSALFWKT